MIPPVYVGFKVFGWPVAPAGTTWPATLPNDKGHSFNHPSTLTPPSPPSPPSTETVSPMALSPADAMDSEYPPALQGWLDDDPGNIIREGLALREQWQMEANYGLEKRRDSGWMVKHEGPNAKDELNARRPRKRRMTDQDVKTGDRGAARRVETQALPVRRTPRRTKQESKLGHCKLGMNALVEPRQGVSHTFPQGPIESTAGSLEHSQSRMEGGTGMIEDLHDEGETDEERWKRLMKCEDGVWKCMGCGGIPFSDRCTLQRHCKTLVHGKRRDTSASRRGRDVKSLAWLFVPRG